MTKIPFFETLEISNVSTQLSYSFPVEIGNISEKRIKNIVSFSSADMDFSPTANPVIEPVVFKNAYLKLATKGNFVKHVNIPLQMLNTAHNNGQIFDFEGLMIDPKNCAIVLGKNDISQVGKNFVLGFILE